MSRNRPAADAYTALGRALAAIIEPMIRQAIHEAVTQALAQSEGSRTAEQPMGFSPDDAAHFAGVSTSTFYKEVMPFVYAGVIESYKIGRRRLIVADSLRAWLNETARTAPEHGTDLITGLET